MDVQRHVDEIREVLTNAGYEFAYDETSDEFFMRFGSAAVLVQVLGHDDGDLILVHSPVLFDVDPSARSEVLEEINRLNCTYLIGTFCYYVGADEGSSWSYIRLEHYLLAEHLQADELLHALGLIERTVEDEDDKLQAKLGTGKRAVDYWDWDRSPVAPPSADNGAEGPEA